MMKRTYFTAQELYIMAAVAQKSRMYGIPDGFTWLDEKAIPAAKQDIRDQLLNDGIIDMDFDGNMTLAADYHQTINICCDCRKCLTLNRKTSGSGTESLIFWQLHDQFYMAAAGESGYSFYPLSADEIRSALSRKTWQAVAGSSFNDVIIPYVELRKAKQFAASDDRQGALRILLQNGADRYFAEAVYNSLQESCSFLGLLLMDMTSGRFKKTEKSYLYSRGLLLSLEDTSVNYKPCTRFTSVSEETGLREISVLAEKFLSKDGD